jgi:Fe-S-cluster containining protein
MADGAYLAFVAKVDAFAQVVHAGQASFLRCKRGCDGCCRVRRTASAVETDHIRSHLSELSVTRREALRRRRDKLDASGESKCVFLDDDGGCAVYAARPLICRTHGPAVRLPDGELAWCELNFTDLGTADVSARVDGSTILDVNLLNHTLAVINAQYIAGTDRPARMPLAKALDPVWP